MVQAASTTVEADCRRLAMHVGYGRTTVSKALRDLAKVWASWLCTLHSTPVRSRDSISPALNSPWPYRDRLLWSQIPNENRPL